MLKKISDYLKSHISKMIIRGLSIFTIACMMVESSVDAFATPSSSSSSSSGAGDYTKPLTALKTVITDLLFAGGCAVLAYGVYSIAKSIKKQDQGGIEDAIGTLVMGGIMVAGTTLVGTLGG